MDTKESLLDIVPILYKRRKFILLVSLIAFVGSILISLSLPNYYKSTTVFYPASTDLANPLPIGSIDKPLYLFGSGVDIDRLLSIAKSHELFEYLIAEFDLYTHYGIDPKASKATHKIRTQLNDLYQIQKTKFGAIELSVEDVKPEKAAQMTTKAREEIDRRAQSMIKLSQQQMLEFYGNSVESKEQIVNKITDSLVLVRKKYDIYNTESQSEVLSTLQAETESKLFLERAKLKSLENSQFDQDSVNYIKAVVSGLENSTKQINSSINKFSSGLQDVINLSRQEGAFITQLNLDKERYKQLLSAYQAKFTSIHLVQDAEVPIIKSRPKRSIYVLAASFLAFAFSVLFCLVQHAFRGISLKD